MPLWESSTKLKTFLSPQFADLRFVELICGSPTAGRQWLRQPALGHGRKQGSYSSENNRVGQKKEARERRARRGSKECTLKMTRKATWDGWRGRRKGTEDLIPASRGCWFFFLSWRNRERYSYRAHRVLTPPPHLPPFCKLPLFNTGLACLLYSQTISITDSSALAPTWAPPYKRNGELSQWGPLYLSLLWDRTWFQPQTSYSIRLEVTLFCNF